MQQKIINILFVLFFTSTVYAQNSNTKQEQSYTKASLSYLSNNVYNGRKDSLLFPYITPSLTYYNKSGFSIGGSVSYATTESKIDLITIDAGYDFTIAKNFSGSAYASKYFYNSNSNSVKGSAKGNLGVSFAYEPGLINASIDAGILFSNKSDFYIIPSIYHDFELGNDDNTFTISPTATINLGTLNYYKSYLTNTKRNNILSQLIQVKNTDGLLLLDYELSIPVKYDAHNWGLFFTPTLAIPKSPAELTRPNGNVFYTEKLENTFFAEFGVYIHF
jgi:hypothetical protein